MNDPQGHPAEERVLVLAPTARDGALCRAILTEAGMACAPCADLAEPCRELEAGAGAAVLTEEALGHEGFVRLVETLLALHAELLHALLQLLETVAQGLLALLQILLALRLALRRLVVAVVVALLPLLSLLSLLAGPLVALPLLALVAA